MQAEQLADALEDAVHAVLIHYRVQDTDLIQNALDDLSGRFENIRKEFAPDE